MSFLLNRDVCMGWLRGRPRLLPHVQQHAGQLHVSAVTIMQIELWLLHRNTPGRVINQFAAFHQSIVVLSVDDAIAHQAARVGHRLRSQGHPLSSAVLLVAATALVRGFTLVTHAPQAFTHIPGLTLVDWSVP